MKLITINSREDINEFCKDSKNKNLMYSYLDEYDSYSFDEDSGNICMAVKDGKLIHCSDAFFRVV